MDGILIVNKPIGKTSFQMVAETRKKFNTKKVGHIGTLDPMASGVLPILIGQATKLSDYLMNHDKEYVAVLKLGIKTDTGDSEGKIIERKEVKKEKLEEKNIEEVLKSFLGESEQIPPMYSAIKVNGKKLYELARDGKEIERKPRKIFISEIELLNFGKGTDSIILNAKNENEQMLSDLEDKNNSALLNDRNKNNYISLNTENESDEIDEIKFRVVCSKGTYIRTLCEDIAQKLETCGYMKSLVRTRVGDFNIADEGKFISIEKLFENSQSYNLDEDEYKKIINGMTLITKLKSEGYVRLYKDKCNDRENEKDKDKDKDKCNCIDNTDISNNNDDKKSGRDKKFVGLGICKNGKLKRSLIIGNDD